MRIQSVTAASVFLIVFAGGMGAGAGGCSGNIGKTYPQYSGTFTLMGEPSVSIKLPAQSGYSLKDITGNYRFPSKIRITHQAKHDSSSFFHYLRVEPQIAPIQNLLEKSEASAPFTVALSDLIRTAQGSIENPAPAGITVYREAKITSNVNPGCSLGNEWQMSVSSATGLTPSAETLSKIYQDHEVVMTQRGPIETQLPDSQLADPAQDQEAVDQWDQQTNMANGATITFTLSMGSVGYVGGCQTADGDFPFMDRPAGTITATYHADISDLDDITNPIVTDLSPLRAGADHGRQFWGQIVNKPWELSNP